VVLQAHFTRGHPAKLGGQIIKCLLCLRSPAGTHQCRCFSCCPTCSTKQVQKQADLPGHVCNHGLSPASPQPYIHYDSDTKGMSVRSSAPGFAFTWHSTSGQAFWICSLDDSGSICPFLACHASSIPAVSVTGAEEVVSRSAEQELNLASVGSAPRPSSPTLTPAHLHLKQELPLGKKIILGSLPPTVPSQSQGSGLSIFPTITLLQLRRKKNSSQSPI